MRFKTKIEFRDYLNLMFLLTYRKPIIILLSLTGIILIAYSAACFAGIFFNELSWLLLILGIYLIILMPLAIYRTSKKNFNSNKRIQETIEYEFEEGKMKITGESFITELGLDKTYKIEELKNWFLMFQSKPTANLIPKENMSEEEIITLRELFRKQKNTLLKLK